MPDVDQGLFRGVAVVIDDHVVDAADAQLSEIVAGIREGGGQVLPLRALPTSERELANLAGVSFVILDWNLQSIEADVPVSLRKAYYQANVDFIRNLSRVRHVPVVIFTNEDCEEVCDFLTEHDDMAAELDSGRLLVRAKSEVGSKVYEILNQWASRVPSVLTLKTWEHAWIAALNEVFRDFHNRSPAWPALLWETLSEDVPAEASHQLGEMLTRLVSSRMEPFELDLSQFVDGSLGDESHQAALRLILGAERTLPAEKLASQSIAAGDFFRCGNKDLMINVRPDCDTVLGRGDRVNASLYLLRGKRCDEEIDHTYGHFLDRDDRFSVFAMFEGDSYCFRFKDLTVKSFSEAGPRLGRLLPPFSTRLQQKYAAYLQRAGLPAIPRSFRAAPPATESKDG